MPAQQDPEAHVVNESTPDRPTPLWLAASAWVVRVITRLWVVSLLLLAAAFGGISVYQMVQAQAQLEELRTAPGPDSYALVAYRRELERQIQAYRRNWQGDAAPTPPPRPVLLEEIDLARQRNQDLMQTYTAPAGPISAPP